MNRNDAPEGFYADKSNPQHECRGCHWETEYYDECPRKSDVLWCNKSARRDGVDVIFVKESICN